MIPAIIARTVRRFGPRATVLPVDAPRGNNRLRIEYFVIAVA
jgi:hypothetical protein